PLLGQGRVVLPRAEATGDGGGGERGLPSAHGPAAGLGQAVNDAARFGGRVLQVLHALVDDALGNGDAGVLGGPQGLHLRDGNRALVHVMAVGRRGVIPAAARRLRPAGEFDRSGQDVLEPAAAVVVLLLAVDRNQEEKGEAVAVHVAARFHGIVGIGQEAVALAALHEPIDGPANV